MCGIFGIVSNKPLDEIMDSILNAYVSLEYRGSDSFGFVIFDDTNKVYVRKVGGLNIMEKAIHEVKCDLNMKKLTSGGVGLAHNRWATNGGVSEINAHPHMSGDFYVIHNGIIENEQELKNTILKNYRFKSSCDSEVICALANKLFNDGVKFEELGNKIKQICKGIYSFVLANYTIKESFIVVKNGLGVIIGLSDDGKIEKNQAFGSTFIVSSDEIVFGSQGNFNITKKLILEDGEIFIVKNNVGYITDGINLESRIRKVSAMKNEGVYKGSYPHFIIKEINEQKTIVTDIINKYVDFQTQVIRLPNIRDIDNNIPIKNEDDIRSVLASARVIRLIACGTSYYACLGVKAIFNMSFSSPVTIDVASDFSDSKTLITSNDVFIFVSQSGETADAFGIQQSANQANATTICCSNKPYSVLAQHANYTIDLNITPEVGIPSTKGYIAEILIMTLFCMMFGRKPNIELFDTLAELPKLVSTSLEVNVQPIIDLLKYEHSVLILGRGFQLSTILEAALKFKEMAYIHAEGITIGELKHGSLALVTKEQPLIFVVSKDDVFDKAFSGFQQMVCRGGNPVIITTFKLASLFEANGFKVVAVPETNEFLQSLLMIIPVQLAAYHIAVMRGIDPDHPRNVAKTCTVE